MKRFSLDILAALLVFSVVALELLRRSYKSITSPAVELGALPLNFPCTPGAFTLKARPEATRRLKIDEANCNGNSSNARLTLQNVGHKAVRGYEVANIEDYEYKHGSESSQGVIASAGVLYLKGFLCS